MKRWSNNWQIWLTFPFVTAAGSWFVTHNLYAALGIFIGTIPIAIFKVVSLRRALSYDSETPGSKPT